MDINLFSELNHKIKTIWTDFEKQVESTPFHYYEWINHWYKTVGKPLLKITPQIIHLHKNGKTIMILPLCIRKKMGCNILEWMGGINTDYMGPIYRSNYIDLLEREKIWLLIESTIKNYDIIHFQKQSQSSIKFLCNIGFLYKNTPHLLTNKVTLGTNWDEHYETINKKIRSDSERQIRRLKKIGKVEFNFAQNINDKKKIIDSMISQKSSRYQATKVWDMFTIEEYQNFYKGLANLDINFIHCSELIVDGHIAAAHVGVFDDSTFYYLMPSHNQEKWGKYSPGRLLLLELMKWAIYQKKNFFDFTVGGEKYKKAWCDYSENLYEIINAKTIKGSFFLINRNLIVFLKKIINRFQLIEKIIRYLRSLIVNK